MFIRIGYLFALRDTRKLKNIWPKPWNPCCDARNGQRIMINLCVYVSPVRNFHRTDMTPIVLDSSRFPFTFSTIIAWSDFHKAIFRLIWPFGFLDCNTYIPLPILLTSIYSFTSVFSSFRLTIAPSERLKKIMDRLTLPKELWGRSYGIALRASSTAIP